jgi:hypothetical protein
MFYQDYQTIAQLKKQEVENLAKYTWKFYEQPELKSGFWPTCTQKQQSDQCCPAPAVCC